jgi:hypothetical protein
MPNTDSDAPKRMKLRSASEEPNFAKSKTDRDDPRREQPYTDRELPMRTKDLSASEAPTCAKSSTDSELPSRAMP